MLEGGAAQQEAQELEEQHLLAVALVSLMLLETGLPERQILAAVAAVAEIIPMLAATAAQA
jgi:hypothetical protein